MKLPEGWPTKKMIEAAWAQLYTVHPDDRAEPWTNLQIALKRALAAAPTPPEQDVPEDLRIRIRDAIAETLGDAYDCTRVWSAWNVGTMSQDDFVPVAEDEDRLQEIVDAVLKALPPAQEAEPIEYQIRMVEKDAVGGWVNVDKGSYERLSGYGWEGRQLYTHPDNSKLRKAAEPVLRCIEHNLSVPDGIVENLRKALDGKP